MSRIVYTNGSYVPEDEARISVFDRGFLFGDAVYEVTSVLEGRLIDFPGHMRRLRRSLAELALPSPAGDEELLDIHRELLRRNDLGEGGVYMMVSRGAADRDFVFPPEGTPPTLVAFTQSWNEAKSPEIETGLKVAFVPDLRWGRRDIKTVQLLWPSMAKMEARRQGKDDAWLVEDGMITEGTSNNAFIIDARGHIITRALSNSILHGTTRANLLRLAAEKGLVVEERPFSTDEARNAVEAFITSAGAFVMPVTEIDGVAIGDGRPGPITRTLRRIYMEEALRTAI
ncbi:D-amino-acid transaminase [Aureimonas altamirensis]|uniref:D-amino-acid transaminase n=1 Tax=Aureimonas altamirensis TaxID=370622 RepID=UPI0020373D00|nr:D-amino-acid transaminase [Aureimonas altamirensis]MCM2505171.1 D-amino-acid transaminase [Aureimonas altamirensis]